MKTLVILCIALSCCVCLAYAAPAENSAGVQFLKYSNDQEFEEIKRQIIAQYDHLGGSSEIHQVKSASFVDPNNIKISF